MTKHVSDLKLLMDLWVLDEQMSDDNSGVRADLNLGEFRLKKALHEHLPRFRKSTQLSDLRIKVWSDEANFPVDNATKESLKSLCEKLKKANCGVVDDSCVSGLPEIGFTADEIFETYLTILCGVYSGRLSDSEISFCNGPFDDDEKEKDLMLSKIHHISHRQVKLAEAKREKICNAFNDEIFGDFDFVLAPVAMTRAFQHQNSPAFMPFFVNNKRTLNDVGYERNVFWTGCLGNLTKFPATAFPVALNDDDYLPMGFQLIGKRFDDFKVIEGVRLISEALQNRMFEPGIY